MLIAFNKPFGVLSQFRDEGANPGLARYIKLPGVYAAGRLDMDSEGLLLLTDDGALANQITEPRRKLEKTYLAQVEGEIDQAACHKLAQGVVLKDGRTLPAFAARAAEPNWLWPRDPPVRFRAQIPTSWLELRIREGRNRQVRRMTAAVGFPTLRLIRVQIGQIKLGALALGMFQVAAASELR